MASLSQSTTRLLDDGYLCVSRVFVASSKIQGWKNAQLDQLADEDHDQRWTLFRRPDARV